MYLFLCFLDALGALTAGQEARSKLPVFNLWMNPRLFKCFVLLLALPEEKLAFGVLKVISFFFFCIVLVCLRMAVEAETSLGEVADDLPTRSSALSSDLSFCLLAYQNAQKRYSISCNLVTALAEIYYHHASGSFKAAGKEEVCGPHFC